MERKFKYVIVVIVVVIVIAGGVSYYLIDSSPHFGFPSSSSIYTDMGNNSKLNESKVIVGGPASNISKEETLYFNKTINGSPVPFVTIIEAHANSTNKAKALYKTIFISADTGIKNSNAVNISYLGFLYTVVNNNTAFGYKGNMLFVVAWHGTSVSVTEKLAKSAMASMSGKTYSSSSSGTGYGY
ncbi:MAG: hypothetical protein RE471_05490 [Ferroplasma sp.]|uniref:hypothetical protein n=1 Tax=Ferroplasma sp. TaxID=2591003 RepID=UPI002815F458|nr:hypothetical protein [Ferroplasma sp.]WMT50435.1 MAG: hypothetical protein RE471_05490 [Ferroplasma sp.]